MNGTDTNTPTQSPPAGGNWFDQVDRTAAAPALQRPGAGSDWFSQVGQSAPATPQLTQVPANPKEGIYTFLDPQGKAVPLRYSQALDVLGHPEQGLAGTYQQALDALTKRTGLTLSQQDTHRLYSDYTHDPEILQSLGAGLPEAGMGAGFVRHALRSAVGGTDIIKRYLNPQWGPPDQPSQVRQYAEAPDKNLAEMGGGSLEDISEFMAPEALLGKIRAITKAPVLIADAAKVEQEIKKGSTLGRLALDSIKNAGISGAQTYVRTGGDIGEAGKSGLEMAGMSAIVGSAGLVGENALTAWQEAGMTRAATEAARIAEAGRTARNEAEMANYKQASDQYKSDLQIYNDQVKSIKAEYSDRVKVAKAQDRARIDAQFQKDLTDANAAHMERVNAWKVQNAKAREIAYQQWEAGEAEHAGRTQVEQEAFEQRKALAQQKAETTAGAVKAQEEARIAGEEEARKTAVAGAYGTAAGGAIEPHLRALEETGGPRQITMAQPGGGPGVSAGEVPAIVNFNTKEVLSRVGDYSGARTELQNALNQTADAMDAATDGQYRDLNEKVSRAQNKAYKTEAPEDVKAYQDRLNEMDDLLERNSNRMRPGLADAVRKGWRQYYVMGDITNGFDRSVEGIPGDTSVSQTQRGINGKTLTDEVKKAVIKHGRPVVVQAMGGEDQMRSVEQLAQQTSTNAGRQAVNKVIVDVSKYLEPVEPPNLPPAYPKFQEPAPATPKPQFVKPTKPPAPVYKSSPDISGMPKPVPPEAPTPEQGTAPPPEKAPKGEPKTLGKAAAEALRWGVRGAAWTAGYHTGGLMGGSLAAGGAEAAMRMGPMAVQSMQKAMFSNPRFVQAVLYAAKFGTDPKVYGPALAQIFVKEQEQRQEQQPTQEEK